MKRVKIIQIFFTLYLCAFVSHAFFALTNQKEIWFYRKFFLSFIVNLNLSYYRDFIFGREKPWSALKKNFQAEDMFYQNQEAKERQTHYSRHWRIMHTPRGGLPSAG